LHVIVILTNIEKHIKNFVVTEDETLGVKTKKHDLLQVSYSKIEVNEITLLLMKKKKKKTFTIVQNTIIR